MVISQIRMKMAAVAVLTIGAFLGAAKAAAPGTKPADTAGGELTLLEIIGRVQPCGAAQGNLGVVREEGRGTFWRYFETWQTEVVRKDDGKLVRVDPLNPRADVDFDKLWKADRSGDAKTTGIPLRETDKIMGSAFPPADWIQPDFDDSAWIRTATPIQMGYRSLCLLCVRGKFTVNDPARVTELTLAASIQGGAVVYINGKEAGRFSLPEGKIANDTPAENYPPEAFFTSSGDLLALTPPYGTGGCSSTPVKEEEIDALATRRKDAELPERYKKRFRHISLKIPANLLRKGVNVLALEVHRAPALEGMFAKVKTKLMGYNLTEHYDWFWNRADIDGVKLTAKASPESVVANVTRPAGVQLWNWPTAKHVGLNTYGDPNEPVFPIRLVGAKNGAFAGQVVVSSRSPIKALKAEVTDLKSATGQIIPKTSVRIRYPRYYLRDTRIGFDALENSVPAEIPVLQMRDAPDKVCVQPVWLTIEVPKETTAGDYAGTVSVSADGLKLTAVPVQLHVSDWSIPDPRDFNVYMAFIQSPESLSIRYGVPMWSEQHFKLIDQCYQVLGLIGTKDTNITLVRKTHFGNEHGMVWFVKKPDGTYEPYLDNVEKYIDIVAKRLGKIPTISFYVIEQDKERRPWITEYNPSTKELKDGTAPAWGTPAAVAFWKPAFDGIYKILAKYGMEKSLAIATHAVSGGGPEPSKECVADMKIVAPKAGWVKLAHMWGSHGVEKMESGPGGNPYHRVSLVAGNYGVLWNPDADKPFFGWRNPNPVIMYTRDVFVQGSPLRMPRMAAEMILFAGLRKGPAASFGLADIAGQFGRDSFQGSKGFGPWGADFWPVLGANGKWNDIIARFGDNAGAGSRSYWYTVGLNADQTPYLVGDGETGPVSSIRIELLRESDQEAEAHILCENALMEGKLPADLARRCKEMCNRRLWAMRYDSEFTLFGSSKVPKESHFMFDQGKWQKLSQELYEMAAEVGKALGRK